MIIEVIHTFEKFVELESGWKRLVDDSGLDNPFITFEFFYCLLKAFFEKSELLIFVVKDNGEIIGIAPFLNDTNSIRSISNVHSHYFDFIIKKNRSELYAYVFQHISSNYKFKNIYLGDICSESGLFKHIIADDCFLHVILNERHSPVLKIDRSWDEFYSSISKNFRENVKKRVHRVNAQGGYLYKECSDVDTLDVFLNDLFDIEKKSWKHLLGKSMFSNSKQPVFYSLLSKVFFENVKIEILYINDSPTAFWLSLFYNNSIYQLKNSFVEESKELSPGIILTVECLKSSFMKKVKCIDYLGVTNSVKSRVSNDFRVAYNVALYRKHLINYTYIFTKFKMWPIIGSSSFIQSAKNFILRRSPVEKVNRKTLLDK